MKIMVGTKVEHWQLAVRLKARSFFGLKCPFYCQKDELMKKAAWCKSSGLLLIKLPFFHAQNHHFKPKNTGTIFSIHP